jgi:hypothetical protein
MVKNTYIYLVYNKFLMFFLLSAYDRAAIKFRGVEADINFNIEDYEEDLKLVSYGEEYVKKVFILYIISYSFQSIITFFLYLELL